MQRTILITGAARGLGASLAKALAADQHRIVIQYRPQRSDPADCIKNIREAGGEAEAFAFPLASLDDGARLLDQIMARFGRLDTLINNAGTFTSKRFEELMQEDWDAGLAGTTAAFVATRGALPHLRASGRGRIINIGDSAADRIAPAETALSYYIGKAGVWMMTRTLAASEAQHKVTVNMVSPGRLERSNDSVPLPDMPLGRYGIVEDVLQPIRFLLEDASKAITGTNIHCGGGWNIR